jgi:acyl-CoA thioesterase
VGTAEGTGCSSIQQPKLEIKNGDNFILLKDFKQLLLIKSYKIFSCFPPGYRETVHLNFFTFAVAAIMKKEQTLAERIVDTMYSQDWFSQWLGIERVVIEAGRCVLKMKVRKEMLNGFSIAHGGICYSLADSALAFASNSHGRKAVSVETSISLTEQVKVDDILTAAVEEVSLTNKIGVYYITITNQENKKVGLFKGTVYRTSKDWFPQHS